MSDRSDVSLPGVESPSPQNLCEKIANRSAVGLSSKQRVYAGDFLSIRPRHVMTHDNSSAVIEKFQGLGATSVADSKQPILAIDHDIQNRSEANLRKYATIEAFAKEHGLVFYPPGTGISHQVLFEYGHVIPGSMVVGSDSHSNLYGAVSALGTPVVRTDAASLWATGLTWWQIPPVARVTLSGAMSPGVVGKDVIIALCGCFRRDEVLNLAVEFVGEGIGSLSMDDRLAIANMTTEWGALAGVFPFDEVLRDALYERADFLASIGNPRFDRSDVDGWFATRLEADEGAHYALDIELDLSSVVPHVCGPDDVKTMHSLSSIERERIPIDKAYVLSCVNGRLEDLRAASQVLADKTVAPGVELYVAAASANIEARAREEGVWQILEKAGAHFLPPGCGPCIGLGRGILEDGEVAISATNRNFRGRMGSKDARAYLASPSVVAASAVRGYISAPESFPESKPRTSIRKHGSLERAGSPVEDVEGFPSSLKGRALLVPVDNLNTDGIYSGRMTYRDDVSVREMAEAAMQNYDPNFAKLAKEGDVVVVGRNFGTGSSREQAATCLQALGIRAVIAASASQVYKRNAFNNGLIVVESEAFYEALRLKIGEAEKTIAGPDIEICFQRSLVIWGELEFGFPSLSVIARELVALGGAEAWVQTCLSGPEGRAKSLPG